MKVIRTSEGSAIDIGVQVQDLLDGLEDATVWHQRDRTVVSGLQGDGRYLTLVWQEGEGWHIVQAE